MKAPGDEHPDQNYWWNLKDEVRSRARRHQVKHRFRGNCEFCSWRFGVVLHHRHYDTWGQEGLRDVMLLCGACHSAIHGHLGNSIIVACSSLAAQGMSGMGRYGNDKIWQEYVRTV